MRAAIVLALLLSGCAGVHLSQPVIIARGVTIAPLVQGCDFPPTLPMLGGSDGLPDWRDVCAVLVAKVSAE